MDEQHTSFDAARGAPLGGLSGVNYYRVLDVGANASRIEIREAYLRLKNAYGAGSAALYSLISEEEAEGQMALVEEAFRVLNDEVSRRDYDRKLGAVAATSPDGTRQGAAALGDYAPPAEAPLFGSAGDALGGDRIRTTRSSLPIIKLKANRAADGDTQSKLVAIMEDSDPGDGDLFRRLREAVGVSEEEMCERTKVSIAYVRGIEQNRFERLPQAVYVKGFLRSYFRYLCVPDAEKLVAAFSARLTDWQANRKA